jgi:hypothetical protein
VAERLRIWWACSSSCCRCGHDISNEDRI